ncbi:MAG: carbohydrate-binding family 9-like protein [Verrucomicrobiae bacterium]|nr:carbohydrate-binding family 9-like protein [Verrucomicrobiae bacterium]
MKLHLAGSICGLLAGSVILLLGGETVSPKKADVGASTGRKMTALYTHSPIIMDGILNDDAWKKAKACRLSLPVNNFGTMPESYVKAIGNKLREGGEARATWDDNFFYVGIRFEDSDVVATGKDDQDKHFALGDLVEVFLKPENETWYWELYATPHNKKTCYFFPSRGRGIFPECASTPCAEMKVAATVDGTLNNWLDRDRSWSAEMAVPIKLLTERGVKFGPGAAWRILVSRYNYSRYLPRTELSATPRLSVANYHLLEEYAWLSLEK